MQVFSTGQVFTAAAANSTIQTVATIAALESATPGAAPLGMLVQVAGAQAVGDAGAGVFWANPADIASPSNHATLLVDRSGNRWYRALPTGVLDLGAFVAGNGVAVTDAAMTSGQAVLASGQAQFSAAAVGKLVLVQGAGSGGSALAASIVSVAGGAATLSAAASASVSGAAAVIGSDDTAAVGTAATVLQAMGGGILRAPVNAIICIKPAMGAAVCSLQGLSGVEIDLLGCCIADMNAYPVTGLTTTLFQFTACTHVAVRGRMLGQQLTFANWNTLPAGSNGNFPGMQMVQLLQGCCGVTVALDISGGQLALAATKQASDPAGYISSNIHGTITATACGYGYAGQFSGDTVDLQIQASTCFRPFILYGAKGNRLDVESVNQIGQCEVSAYSGYGCQDITVKYRNIASTQGVSASPCVVMQYNDTTPAVFDNIDLTFDVVNPATSSFGATFNLAKYNGSGAPDDTARGHVLRHLRLHGTSQLLNTSANIGHMTSGSADGYGQLVGGGTTPDIVTGVHVSDLTLVTATPGNNSFYFALGNAHSGVSIAENVSADCGFYMFTGGAYGTVHHRGVVAQNLTGAQAEASQHVYEDCVITDGTIQSILPNKVFRNSWVPSQFLNLTTTNLLVYGGVQPETTQGQASLYGDATNGASIQGAGSTWDVSFCNKNQGVVAGIPTGTALLNVPGLAGSGNRALYADPNGNLTVSASDARLKMEIRALPYGLAELRRLRPVAFRWRDPQRGGQAEIGLIAQEVRAIVPELVGENADGTLSLDYAKLVALVIAAIQQLAAGQA